MTDQQKSEAAGVLLTESARIDMAAARVLCNHYDLCELLVAAVLIGQPRRDLRFIARQIVGTRGAMQQLDGHRERLHLLIDRFLAETKERYG